jgi:hypothetical protein
MPCYPQNEVTPEGGEIAAKFNLNTDGIQSLTAVNILAPFDK